MAVYFHGSFGLHRPRMAGILKQALSTPLMKDTDLAEPFGYKAPFAAKYRTWLEKTGITQKGLPVQLTPQGQGIWEKDPKLEALTTQEFMHGELTKDPIRAETWYFFIHEFLPKYEVFKLDDLLMELTKKLSAHSAKHFGMGSNMNKVIAKKLLDCYTKEEALAALDIIRQEDTWFTKSAGWAPSSLDTETLKK